MNIHLTTPFRIDKHLGIAYNQEFQKVNDDDYVLLRDCDTLILLPDTINHLHGYVYQYPDCDIFTCLSNRNHPTLTNQLLGGKVSDNTDMTYHINLAQEQTKFLFEATEIKGRISGFFMLISKRLWNKIKFPENHKCFGLDFAYSDKLQKAGVKILRMEGVYVWHTYRLQNGINNIKHLL